MTVRIQKILLPTDFSDYSDAAIKYAWELAIRFEAEIHVLHALENHLSSTPSFAMGLDLPGFVSESSQTAKKKLTDLVDAKLAGCRKVIHAVTEGSPKTEIVRYARDKDIDLIVLSTHGRTGLSHIVMGSVAENVVRIAPCPVLTVRPEGHQFVMP